MFLRLFTVSFILLSGLAACKPMHKKADNQTKEYRSKSSQSDSESKDSAVVVCELGSEERTIENRALEGGGCEVIYTKAGEPNVVAEAKNDLSYCRGVVERIQNNLSSAGFECS